MEMDLERRNDHFPEGSDGRLTRGGGNEGGGQGEGRGGRETRGEATLSRPKIA